MKIDFVNNVKTYYSNSDYNPFNQNSGAYYITKQTLEDIYEDHKKKEVRRHKALGLVIGNLALFTALGTFALFKGLPSGLYKKLGKLGKTLEEFAPGGEGQTRMQKFYAKALKWIHKKVDQSRSVNNFTSFKDLLFKKLMYKTKFTTKIHDGITNFFEKLSRNTVERKYRAFENAFKGLGREFDSIKLKEPNKLITIDGVTKTAQEWLEQANTVRGSISKKLETSFGTSARDTRYSTMKGFNEGLEERVLEKSREGLSRNANLQQNVAALKESDVAQSFIAEDILAADKMDMKRVVGSYRNSITRNIDDNYRSARDLLDGIKKCIEPYDDTSKSTIRILEGSLLTYKKLSGATEAQLRDYEIQTIQRSLNAFRDSIMKNSMPYDDKIRRCIVTSLDEIENILTSGKKGDVQELLTIYKNILPRNEYVKLRKHTNAATEKLDRAISTETDEFFDKLRDLKLGAAPTDVLTILTSLGSVGLGLGLAKDRDERVSASLKYGIPVVGGIATTLVMTASLISGFKGMAAGILSSALLSELGDAADKLRKNIKKRMDELQTNEQIIQQENVLENKLEQAA